ncbi:GntR family transcriptional regulator [Microlunatus panaciterrae]|uniref:DNA-binding GntR family transcriptional regulator n=1 Tax=Microlunatus panaciterrae TaxID=400768 RepID=A0ABS2RL77_9ACTN|nr:GntR family transcriptional regulator [Microlunatus panaciterrae]MBM7799760.1 DNA-binding GntR family transcriptional regulator [Microlunatus panaciterrae]
MDRTVPKEIDVVLDRSSPVPLYHQLAQAIEAAITDGHLVPGDRLENELSLTSRLGLARPTARQAIQELTRKGLVVRKRGVGTQVLHPRISRDTKLSSLFDDLVKTGKKPSTRLLEFSEDIDEDVLATLLTSAPDGRFVKVRRLRSADGTPIAILTNYLPVRFELTASILENAGLYAALRSRGVNLRVAHQSVRARLMTEEEATLLDETEPAACLTAERTVYDDAGRFVEMGHHVYRASHYSLEISLVP